ncbi:MAG TPA: hypothetical protein VHA52_01555 [Candidatus Babeliaceae bacterium]|nr:hypothetical protein [Candidatus Babeliaceae bacterium]
MVIFRLSKLILMLFLGLLSQAWAGDMPDDRSLAFPSNTTIPANMFANQTSDSSWYGSIGSGIGNALSSSLSGAGYYLGKLVPSSVTNFFNDLGKNAMAKGISAYNYIASLAPESPVLEGGALQAAKDSLSALKDQATDLLEQAIQLNQRLTAYAGVSERYQRPAAIGLLVGETIATIAMLYYAIGFIKATLAAGANKSLTKVGEETVEANVKATIDDLTTQINNLKRIEVGPSTLTSSAVSSVAQPETWTQSSSALGASQIRSLLKGENLSEGLIEGLVRLREKWPGAYNSLIAQAAEGSLDLSKLKRVLETWK